MYAYHFNMALLMALLIWFYIMGNFFRGGGGGGGRDPRFTPPPPLKPSYTVQVWFSTCVESFFRSWWHEVWFVMVILHTLQATLDMVNFIV